MNRRLLASLNVIAFFLSACVATPTPAATQLPAATATIPIATAPVPASSTATPVVSSTVPPVGQPLELLHIEMLDTLTGWAVGIISGEQFERILRTSDGGATWQDVTPPERAADLGAANLSVLAAFSGAQHAWALYYANFPAPSSDAFFTYHTADGGATWQAGELLDLNNLTMDFFLPGELGFSDENNGWLLAHLGSGMNHDYVALYKTSDAGQTWARVVEPSRGADNLASLPMSCAKTGVTFVDAQTGWVSGNCQGVVAGVFFYQTRDGGATWLPVDLPAPIDQPDLLDETNACGAEAPLFQGQTGYLSVTCMTGQGSALRSIYRTTNLGQTWTGQPTPASYGALAITPQGKLFLLGSNDRSGEEPRTLFASSDEGQSWEVLLDGILWDGRLDFVDQQTVFALVNLGDQRQLLHSNDGGATWLEIHPLLVAP